MGTNYYAHIIPTAKRKEEIKKSIDNNDFKEIQSLVNKTYSSPQYDFEEHTYLGGKIHLGKRSCGWKFLWNPNWYKLRKGHIEYTDNGNGSKSGHWVDDGYDVFKYYDLTKKSIKTFIDREDVEIYDEYNEKQDKEEFWEMVKNWGYEKDDKGWDGEAYEEWEKSQNPNHRTYEYKTDYTRFLEECGFTMCKYNTDFYSDGLRFATTTEFS